MKENVKDKLVITGRVAVFLTLFLIACNGLGVFKMWQGAINFIGIVLAAIILLSILFLFVKISTKRFLICSGSLSLLMAVLMYFITDHIFPPQAYSDWISRVPICLTVCIGVFGACFLLYLLFLKQAKGKEVIQQ